MVKIKTSKNYNFFLKADLSDYENQWVAIAKNKIVAHGRRADKVFDAAKEKAQPQDISLAKVPKKGQLTI